MDNIHSWKGTESEDDFDKRITNLFGDVDVEKKAYGKTRTYYLNTPEACCSNLGLPAHIASWEDGEGWIFSNANKFQRVTVDLPAVQAWLVKAQEIINEDWAKNDYWMPVPQLTLEQGKRYIKVVREGSVHCFIDRNGDILKAASWAKPAKHARGNLFDENNGVNCMTPHGAAYLR